MQKIVIAIDGYSSCGKSTIAKQLAKRLAYRFIDSGAMYRAIALYFINNKIDIHSEVQIINAIKNIYLEFIFNPAIGKSEIHLNGENVENEIRTMEVNNYVSEIAKIKAIREFAVEAQQKMGGEKGIVMDGRDIGTVVFPHAELKIFMTADPKIRAERRYKELHPFNPTLTLEEVAANLKKRDLIDTTREISPLRKAEDAITLDNSQLTIEEQLCIVLEWVDQKLNISKNL